MISLRQKDGQVAVSSPLTRGHAATVWFSADGAPHVLWAVTPDYRNGLTEALIIEAVLTAPE